MAYLTVPISACNIEQALSQIKAAVNAGAQMLELRTDYLENLSVEIAKKLISMAKADYNVPLIVTCRDIAEGGSIDYPDKLRLDVLTMALASGADFIDCEFNNFTRPDFNKKITDALSANTGSRLILSTHNFDCPFDDLAGLDRKITEACPSAIAKLVYQANHINDCFTAFDLLHESTGDKIVLCMGEAGVISRILAGKLGAFLTFASLDAESSTAPGQISVSGLKDLYRWHETNRKTELFGVVADPVAHSMSPVVHNECFKTGSENKLYLPLLVGGAQAGFEEFMQNVLDRQWLDFKGFSVTLPHKKSAIDFVEKNGGYVEPLTRKIGAANTLTIDAAGRLSAFNTDYPGAMIPLKASLEISGRDIRGIKTAVIGAGGVARAIVAGLSDSGAKVTIYNRTVEKARDLAKDFGCDFAGIDELRNLDAQVIVNCTSIGMHPKIDASPLPKDLLKSEMVVFDTVYNPQETLLLKNAKAAGCLTIGGIEMFINQAAEQFRIFTSSEPDINLIRNTISDCLAAK